MYLMVLRMISECYISYFLSLNVAYDATSHYLLTNFKKTRLFSKMGQWDYDEKTLNPKKLMVAWFFSMISDFVNLALAH